MNDAITLLKKLVAQGPPWYWEHNDMIIFCAYCDAQFPYDMEGEYDNTEEVDDENQHKDDCPWRLAKEYIGNLDNQGY